MIFFFKAKLVGSAQLKDAKNVQASQVVKFVIKAQIIFFQGKNANNVI